MNRLVKIVNGKKYVVNTPHWSDYEAVDPMYGPWTGSIPNILPFISLQPNAITTITGSTVFFTINAGPSGPFDNMVVSWETGSNSVLSDKGNYSGSSTQTLKITNVSSSNAGSYFVLVKTPYGSITSSHVSLTTIP